MPSFRGMRQSRRGGSGSYQDMYGGGQQSRPAQSPAQPANAPTPSGRGHYKLEGGGYIRTTPTEGYEGRRHDVTVYGDDHKPQYQVGSAEFGHDSKTNQAKFFGGKDLGSGQRMGHTWSGKTMGGNLHQDDSPY
jgi:hypothetical protein